MFTNTKTSAPLRYEFMFYVQLLIINDRQGILVLKCTNAADIITRICEHKLAVMSKQEMIEISISKTGLE